ncbi:MAG: CRISPR system precrRNA processing endoribonuclease RAMP protein Cas6 [Acidobacteria bacterium]|nr:MAG: CRISPR system precrRNA processing endoribonuclease RAMP protein Cas6 [Acidobacteriota bacterium]
MSILRDTLENCEFAKVLSALGRFSIYSGVGRKTTMGMGRVRFKGL